MDHDCNPNSNYFLPLVMARLVVRVHSTFNMKLFKMLLDKLKGHKHHYITRYDEIYDLEDEKHHTFQITYCEECGKVKNIEKLQ